ncbi:MAG: hypothetical protein IPM36_19815 [Lewinellaceae bacterium]|nr:hypothetical protein [Lewinellaceae bacterium]
MLNRLHILLLLFAVWMAAPAGAVQACTTAENAVAHADSVHCATTGDTCADTHPGQDCPPDTDGCGHCHCPGCGANGAMGGGFLKSFSLHFEALAGLYTNGGANFYYRAPATSAHLAVLLRPPIVPLV